ncbi:MAG: hypothetical protein U0M33_04120 [Lachnospiraceae bacterium]|nr:hypothetical protein [Lachnospiraceae bacterium]
MRPRKYPLMQACTAQKGSEAAPICKRGEQSGSRRKCDAICGAKTRSAAAHRQEALTDRMRLTARSVYALRRSFFA